MALFPILTSDGSTITTSDAMAVVVAGGTPPAFASQQIILGKGYGNQTGQVQSDPLVVPCYTGLRGPIWGTNGSSDAFQFSHPWSVDGTFKHLYVEIVWPEENPAGGGWPDIDFELYINETPTGLIVTVPAHGASLPPPGYISSAQNTVDEAPITAGQRVALVRGAGQIPPGLNQFTAMLAWSITFESDTAGESGYGVNSYGTGALGASNQLFTAPLSSLGGFALPSDDVVPNSIVPLEGSLFRLDVGLSAAPGAGKHRTFAAVLNSVIQDGSGGTVDTTLTISDSATSGFATFDLPMGVLDLLSIVQLVSTTPASAMLTCSVGIRATTPGQSALCFYNVTPDTSGAVDYTGGSDGGFANSTPRAPTPWSTSKLLRWPMSEYSMSLPGSIDPYTLSSLCVHLTFAPGATKSWTFTTRNAFADTAAVTTVSGASDVLVVGTGTAGAFTGPDSRLDLQAVATNSPHSVSMAWTWLVVQASTPIVSTSFPIRRLRRWAL